MRSGTSAGRWRWILEELLERPRRGYIAPTSLAVRYAGLGDTSETYAWLRRALEGHDPFLIYNCVNDPVMAPFRRDPRGPALRVRTIAVGAALRIPTELRGRTAGVADR